MIPTRLHGTPQLPTGSARRRTALLLVGLFGATVICLSLVAMWWRSDSPYSFREIAHLRYGSGKMQVGLLCLPEVARAGPESFWADERGVYICDTVNHRIQHVSPEGRLDSEMLLDFPCGDLAVAANGEFFVLDRSRRLLHHFGRDGERAGVFHLPKEIIENGIRLCFSGETLVMVTAEHEEYELARYCGMWTCGLPADRGGPTKGVAGAKGNRFLAIRLDGERGEVLVFDDGGNLKQRVPILARGLASIEFLGEDQQGNFYIQVERAIPPQSTTTLAVYCFDAQGAQIFILDKLPNAYQVWTTKLLQIDVRGNIYQVLPADDGVKVNAWIRQK